MLSRVAESVFWMARYMERTNGLLRVLRTNYVASQDDEIMDLNWQSVLRTYGSLTDVQIAEIQQDSRAVLRHVMLDRDNGASLINNITRARENARAVQDHITKEMWQALNGYYLLIRESYISNGIHYDDPITTFDALIKHGLYLHGTVDITMSRGEAYTYLNVGRYIERAIITLDTLIIRLGNLGENYLETVETPGWRYLLYSLSGYEQYLKSHKGVIHPKLVIKQILFDANFVHSVMYCLSQVERYFKRLQLVSIEENYKELEFIIGKTKNGLKYAAVEYDSVYVLRQLLLQTRGQVVEVANGFNKNYFGYN